MGRQRWICEGFKVISWSDLEKVWLFYYVFLEWNMKEDVKKVLMSASEDVISAQPRARSEMCRVLYRLIANLTHKRHLLTQYILPMIDYNFAFSSICLRGISPPT